MNVDAYELLAVLQMISYLSGECNALAKSVDSEKAAQSLRYVGGYLKNTADDVRTMFDKFEEQEKEG